MDELKVFALFVFLVLSLDDCLFWLVSNVVDMRDELKAEAMNVS